MADDLNSGDGAPYGLRDRFFRERRMLLAVSLVLFAHVVSGIDIAHQGEAFGLIFTVSKPSYIWGSAWVLWGWTLLCYAQHFNSLRLWKEYPTDRDMESRRSLVYRILARRARIAARGFLAQEIGRRFHKKCTVDDVRQIVSGPNIGRQDDMVVSVAIEWSESVHAIEGTAARFDAYMEERGWTVRGGELGKQGATRAQFRKSISVPTRTLIDAKIVRYCARTWVLLSTSFGTEYVAPLAIGILPLVVAVWAWVSAGVLVRWWW